MKIQDLFDVAYSVHLVGVENEYQLSRTFFMRSGRRMPYKSIKAIYLALEEVVSKKGYNDPFEYLRVCFPRHDYESIKILRNPIIVKEAVIPSPQASIPQPFFANEVDCTQNDVEAPKVNSDVKTEDRKIKASKIPAVKESEEKQSMAMPKGEISISGQEESKHKIKINKSINKATDATAIDIPSRDKIKILKYKKSSKKHKEMDPREKEMDNRYDFFELKSRMSESKSEKTVEDNRILLGENPFMGQSFGDLDVEFRNLMYKIYKNTKSKMKDKSNLKEEMEFLEEYFCKKLHISKEDDGSAKKLANAIAYLMKKLQNKIFESDDPTIVASMLLFKSRLCSFYNFYRK